MSRIFDAMRKFEQERAGKKAEPYGMEDWRWPDFLTSGEEPKRDLNNVEHVTSQPGPEQHILLRLGSHEVAAEMYRVLRHRLQQLRQQRTLKKLVITSPAPQEGKTSTAINLATTLVKSFVN